MPYQIEMIEHSEIFERLTGKIQPSLSHPTSKAFDSNAWVKTIDIKGASIEDKRLLTAAIYLGDQIKTLRQFHVDELFHGFSSIDVVRFAIGSANRAVIMARRKLRSAKFLDENESVRHITAISSIRLETAFSDQTPDDISVAAIDSLPHWFAQAVDCDDQIQHKLSKKIHYRNISAKAAACMSLEKSLRDLWQQALWEGWILDIKSEEFSPKSFDEAALWYAWKKRQSVIANQVLNLDYLFEINGGDNTPIMQKVVANVKISGGRYRIRLAPPNQQQRTHHFYELEIARKSYLGPFLDELIDGKDNTFRNLLHAWLLLKTLADALTSNCKNFEFEKYSDFKKLSFEMHEEQVRKLFSECLDISSDRAARLQQCLTLDPDNIPDAFKWGAWHRPLIRNAENNRVMILTATLQSADIIYVMERWSSAFGLAKKIEAYSLGHAYEKSVRELLISSIEENEILSDAQVSKKALSRHTDADEEIDILIRVGKLLMVGEIKCFVRPTEPIDTYNHLKKIYEAASQVQRKCDWLRKNPEKIKFNFGKNLNKICDLNIVPLVIINNGIGTGLKIGDSIICDTHWLNLVLSGGSHASGAIKSKKNNESGIYYTNMYDSIEMFESNYEAILTEPSVLGKLLTSIIWEDHRFPTVSGGWLKIKYPSLSNQLLVKAEGITL